MFQHQFDSTINYFEIKAWIPRRSQARDSFFKPPHYRLAVLTGGDGAARLLP